MALKGDLTDLSVADLIQLYAQAGAQAHVLFENGDRRADLFFSGGEVVHAVTMGLEGEQAVYALLAWQQGRFEVRQNVPPPARTVQTPWSALVLEGLRLRDEQQAASPDLPALNPLEQALQDLLAQGGFQGMILVNRNGLVLASALPAGLDSSRAGAVTAGLLSLAERSVAQLGRGSLHQTLVQGSQGNLILAQAGPQAVLLTLSDPQTNLGLAFLETRQSAQVLASLLGQAQPAPTSIKPSSLSS